MRRLEQRNERSSLLCQRGVVAEIFLGQLLEAEFVCWGEFPCQIEFHGGAQGGGLGHQNTRRRFLKSEQDVGSLGL